MKINSKITIGKNNHNMITVSIRDEKSGKTFFSGRMTLEDFAQAITGLAECPISGEVDNLEKVGKVRVSEFRTVECPVKTYDTKVLRKWLHENCSEPGWIINAGLNTQGSVTYKNDITILRYHVEKYVDSND